MKGMTTELGGTLIAVISERFLSQVGVRLVKELSKLYYKSLNVQGI